MTKEQKNELQKLGIIQDNQQKKQLEQNRLWESEKIELMHKNKVAQRNIIDYREKLKELQRANEEMQKENTQLQINMDEMRSVFRGKLYNFINEVPGEEGLTYNLNAKDELVRTYQDKENDLIVRYEKARKDSKSLRAELEALKYWSRQVKYIAEDWAPIGKPLPDVLATGPPTKLSDEDMDDKSKLLV